jgi:hypothetical protein
MYFKGLSGAADCPYCYKSQLCRYCDGTGFERTRAEKLTGVLARLWVLFALALISVTLYFEVCAIIAQLPHHVGGALYCLLVLISTAVPCVLFLRFDRRFMQNFREERRAGKRQAARVLRAAALTVYTFAAYIYSMYLIASLPSRQ